MCLENRQTEEVWMGGRDNMNEENSPSLLCQLNIRSGLIWVDFTVFILYLEIYCWEGWIH